MDWVRSIWKKERKSVAYLIGLYSLFFLILKICYPTPYYHVDSYGYILCSIKNTIGGYRPFGYSFILRTLYDVCSEPGFVTFFQYLLHALSGTFLLLFVKFKFPPKRDWIFYFFSFLFMASPSLLYLTQWIMSDSIFISLTHLWLLTLLILLFYSKNGKLFLFILFIHTGILFFLYFIRHAGLVFPVLTAGIFILKYRWKGLLIWPLCFAVIFFNSFWAKQMNKKTYGIEIGSGFGGWLKANNALAVIPYIEDKPEDFRNLASQNIYRYAKEYPDSVYQIKHVILANFMWSQKSPLYDHFNDVEKNRLDGISEIALWKETGRENDEFANELILKHPFLFFQKFIVPNTLRIFYHGGVQNFYSLKHDYSHLNHFHEIEEWCKLNENTREEIDIYGIYFNDPYFKWANLLKWIFIFVSIVGFFFSRKFNEWSLQQKYIFITILVFNMFYLGGLAVVVPIIPRFLLVAHGSHLIALYMMLNSFFKDNNK